MRILIIGGFGMVGLSIINELVQRGHSVRVFELKNKKTLKQAKKLARKIEISWGNLLDPLSIQSSLKDVDVVLHMAGIIPPYSENNKELCMKVNVDGTQMLINEIRTLSKPVPILFTSSVSVMGPTQNQSPPINAYGTPNPTSNYTESKVKAEKIIQASGLKYCIFRFSAVLSTTTIADLSIAKEAFEIPLKNRVEMVLDLDLAVAVANAAEIILQDDRLNGKILNIGGGKDFQKYGYNLTQDLFELMGLGKLQEKCYTTKDYFIDWIDTTESQSLLNFQNHSYHDAMQIYLQPYKKFKPFIRLVSPILRTSIEKKSQYHIE